MWNSGPTTHIPTAWFSHGVHRFTSTASAAVDSARPVFPWNPQPVDGATRHGAALQQHSWWLRKLSTAFALPLRSIDLLPEGTLLSASPLQASVRVQVRARFKPTIRARDQRLLPGAVWRNFTSNDRHNDLAVMRHRVIPRPAHPDDLAVRYPARAR